jgi:hypothetical protein
VSKNTYHKYGSALPQQKCHISIEYEEKFTTGQGGQEDGQLTMFKKNMMLQNITQGFRVGQILCSDVQTVTNLLQYR